MDYQNCTYGELVKECKKRGLKIKLKKGLTGDDRKKALRDGMIKVLKENDELQEDEESILQDEEPETEDEDKTLVIGVGAVVWICLPILAVFASEFL